MSQAAPTSRSGKRSGLREAHAHIVQLGRSMVFCDLAGCGSASEALDRLRAHADGLEPGAWVIAHGARPEGWGLDDDQNGQGGWPALADLDEAVGGRPACVWCFDHHAAMGSTAGLAAAGIDGSTANPAGGLIERGLRGAATGLLLESAAMLLWNAVPDLTPAERREAVRTALEHLAGLGYEEVHDMKAQPWLGALLGEMARGGKLPCRVRVYPLVDDLGVVEMGAREWSSPTVRLAGGKIFVDGTLNSRTAWMLDPYADPIKGHERGTPLMSVDQIAEALLSCMRLGVGMAAHAIGDGAVRAVLDAVEKVQPDPRERPGVTRIEHAEFVHPGDIPRFAELGVVASVQPCHLLPDIEALRRLTPDRLDRVMPVRSLIQAGARVWFGSDVPIVPADPEDSIRAAIYRRRGGMDEGEAVNLAEQIPESACLRCFAPAD